LPSLSSVEQSTLPARMGFKKSGAAGSDRTKRGRDALLQDRHRLQRTQHLRPGIGGGLLGYKPFLLQQGMRADSLYGSSLARLVNLLARGRWVEVH